MNTHYLPIYKNIKLLMEKIAKHSANYPRNLRAALSEQMLIICAGIPFKVSKANNAPTHVKSVLIGFVIDDFTALQSLNRLSFDLKAISEEVYTELMNLIYNAKRQSTGWLAKYSE